MKRWQVKLGELVTVTQLTGGQAEAIMVFALSNAFRPDRGSAMMFLARHAQHPNVAGIVHWNGWRKELMFDLLPEAAFKRIERKYKV